MEKEIINTRERIIHVATRLFMDKGYLGTSTRQIAQLAEVTQPSLYHHFKNKEEVYIGVIQALLRDVNKELVIIVDDSSLDTVSKLKKFAECLKMKHPFDFDLMMHDFNTKLMKQTQRELFTLWNQSYKEPLLNLFKESDFSIRLGISPQIATTHFLNILAPYIKMEQRTSTLTIDQVVDLFVNGIAEDISNNI